AEDLQRLGGRPVAVITNGFDPHDVPKPAEPVDDAYSLVHIGSLSPSRNAPELWRALRALCDRDPAFAAKFKLRFVGPVDHTVARSVADAGLGDHLERVGRVDHDAAMRHMQRARVLLLLVNDTPNLMGILPGKVFEYLSVGRPILAIGPVKGDVARVLKGAGRLVIDARDPSLSSVGLRELFEAFPADLRTDDDPFSRTTLARNYTRMLNEMQGQ
ncbi:MAG: glycosyltransferase, partial [Flavobacteriales bacterium]|nr:glycosyltransferase [Flavobacteriales bacterium]